MLYIIAKETPDYICTMECPPNRKKHIKCGFQFNRKEMHLILGVFTKERHKQVQQ